MNLRFLLLSLLALPLVVFGESLEEDVAAAWRTGDFDKVIRLTSELPEESPLIRARAGAFQERGIEHFYEGRIEESIADFDAYLEIYPENDPHHWQRGLCYYYAEEYEKGVAQFERHQTVNSQDVENAVWHFLCAVRAEGGSVEEARKNFIEIDRDQRVPMAEIHDLFAGKGTAQSVLDAAKAEGSRNSLCYAHLYLGLYHEALGDVEKAKSHLLKASVEYRMDHYMGKVAQVHAKLRGWADSE